METRGFDWPAMPPSPRQAIKRRQKGKTSNEDDRLILEHFEQAVIGHSRHRLALLGITSDCHAQQLANWALDWLLNDDFAGYDRGQGLFRFYLRGVIDKLAFAVRRDALKEILPASVKRQVERKVLREDSDARRRTPELTPEESRKINVTILEAFLKGGATRQESTFLRKLMKLSKRKTFDPRSKGIAKKLADMTGWNEDYVRQTKCRIRRMLLALRQRQLNEMFE